MKRITLPIAAAAVLAVPATLAAAQTTTLGSGDRTCVLKAGADCRGVVHRWTAEHHGDLRRVRFTRADLRGADFQGADLRAADFRGALLQHADLRGARLDGARFTQPPRRRPHAVEAPPCALFQCGGGGTPVAVSNAGSGANLAGAQLSGATGMPVATINGVATATNFSGANLSGANLTGARFRGGIFSNADLSGAYLAGANMSWAVMDNADMHAVDAVGADLSMASLAGADLTVANLAGTNLSGASIFGANLTGADLTGTSAAGTTWTSSICPDGLLANGSC